VEINILFPDRFKLPCIQGLPRDRIVSSEQMDVYVVPVWTCVDACCCSYDLSRLYFHTVTCQPMRPQEIDLDSEAENSPPWLYQKTVVVS